MNALPQTDLQSGDEAEAAIAWHDGDPRAAVETLLADCRFLRQQLALTEKLMSPGMSRGWRPTFERPDA